MAPTSPPVTSSSPAIASAVAPASAGSTARGLLGSRSPPLRRVARPRGAVVGCAPVANRSHVPLGRPRSSDPAPRPCPIRPNLRWHGDQPILRWAEADTTGRAGRDGNRREYLRLPSRSRCMVLGIAAVIVCPTLAVISGAATAVAVSRDHAPGIALADVRLEDPPKGAPPTPPRPRLPRPTPSAPAPPRRPRPQVASVAPPRCTGPPLTSQAQVQPNTSYCRGHATSRIVLADGDSWTNGEVSGASTGNQAGRRAVR